MLRFARYPLVAVSISVCACLTVLSFTSAQALANDVTEFEVTVPAGSYVVSPELAFSDADFQLQNGMRHGSNQIAHHASWQYGQQQITELRVGAAHYRLISNAGADLTPAPLHFPLVSNTAAASWQTSAMTTVTGISEPVLVSIHNGEYRIDDGAFTTAPGWIRAGQQLQLRHVTGSTPDNKTTSTVQVGNSQTQFSSALADMDPDPFTFTAVVGAALNATITSNSITVAGIDAATPISVSGGTYSINGNTYTEVAGTVSVGDTVRVQLMSSSSYSTERVATLTIGSQSAVFSVTTLAYDTGGGGGGGGGGGYGGGGGSPSLWTALVLLLSTLALTRRR